jgi:hypothetical protein
VLRSNMAAEHAAFSGAHNIFLCVDVWGILLGNLGMSRRAKLEAAVLGRVVQGNQALQRCAWLDMCSCAWWAADPAVALDGRQFYSWHCKQGRGLGGAALCPLYFT